MDSYTKTKIFNCSLDRLYQVILDVNEYPTFIGPIQSSYTFNETNDGFKATLWVDYKVLKDSYTSHVTFKKEGEWASVNVKAIEGPFKKLTNEWVLESINDSQVKVIFTLDLEFQNALFQSLLKSVFPVMSEKFLKAFEERVQ